MTLNLKKSTTILNYNDHLFLVLDFCSLLVLVVIPEFYDPSMEATKEPSLEACKEGDSDAADQ